MTKLIIFDLDGVLVDTAIYHFQAWKNLGKNFDYELTEEQNEELKGISRVASLDLILTWAQKEASQEEKNRWLIEKNENYLELISNMNPSEILPGVLDFLHQIKEAGFIPRKSVSHAIDELTHEYKSGNLKDELRFIFITSEARVNELSSKPSDAKEINSSIAIKVYKSQTECKFFNESGIEIKLFVNNTVENNKLNTVAIMAMDFI